MQDTSTPTATSKSETNTPSSLPEPKPPVSAYNWFLKHKRLELSNDNDISSPDYMKKIAQMWKNLDPSQQQLYESLAARDYIRWCKELAEFLEQHPEKLKQKTPKQTKRKSTVSGWMLFSNEMRAKLREEKIQLSFKELNKRIADAWNSLTEDEKNKYKEKAKVQREIQSGNITEMTNVKETKSSIQSTSTSLPSTPIKIPTTPTKTATLPTTTTTTTTTPTTTTTTTTPTPISTTKKRKHDEDAEESTHKRQKLESEHPQEHVEKKEKHKEKDTPKKHPEKEKNKEHKKKKEKKHKHHHKDKNKK